MLCMMIVELIDENWGFKTLKPSKVSIYVGTESFLCLKQCDNSFK